MCAEERTLIGVIVFWWKKIKPLGTFHFHEALAYVRAHPGCSMKYLPTRDDKGNRYTPSKVFQALQYHSYIYIDENDKIYPL